MSEEILKQIPDLIDGKQVVVHYFKDDLKTLDDNLDELVFQYGSDLVECVFFEIHDKENRITDFSEQYGDLFDKLSELYLKFGFEELGNSIGCI